MQIAETSELENSQDDTTPLTICETRSEQRSEQFTQREDVKIILATEVSMFFFRVKYLATSWKW